MSARNHRREGGMALLVAVLMLALLATIGFASLNTVTRDREVSGNTMRTGAALAAADAGVAAAMQTLRSDPNASVLAAGQCLATQVPTASLANGSSYAPDSTAGGCSIRYRGWGDLCMEGSSDRWQYRVWDIRAQGASPGGSLSRVQVTIGRCAPVSDGTS